MSMNENRPMTQQDKIAGLSKVNIPLNPQGTYFVETTRNLASKIVDMMVQTFGITECDHVYMQPIKDKAGRIRDFYMAMYFATNRNRNSDNWTIKRAYNGNGNKARDMGDGRINLAGVMGAKTSTGGFELSKEFKETIGTICILNDNNQIVVRADQQERSVAIVDVDFFKVLSICLGVKPDDPYYDFVVADCKEINNGRNEVLDYELQIIKLLTNNKQFKGKSGINYEFRDREMARNYSNR